jgi:hypothetical protein
MSATPGRSQLFTAIRTALLAAVMPTFRTASALRSSFMPFTVNGQSITVNGDTIQI